MIAAVRQTLYEQVGLARDAPGLRAALHRLASVPAGPPLPSPEAAGHDEGRVRRWGEARNMALVGRLIARAALNREESRGAHFRTDFPAPSAAWARRQFATLRDLEAPVPAERPEETACSIP